MTKKLDDIMSALPLERRQRIEARAVQLSTLKGLHLGSQSQPVNIGIKPRKSRN